MITKSISSRFYKLDSYRYEYILLNNTVLFKDLDIKWTKRNELLENIDIVVFKMVKDFNKLNYCRNDENKTIIQYRNFNTKILRLLNKNGNLYKYINDINHVENLFNKSNYQLYPDIYRDTSIDIQMKIKTTDIYTCKRCKQNRCTLERVYNRGLDEETSCRCTCINCGMQFFV